MPKKIKAYFSKHVEFNSTVHVVGGVGLGILLASPLFWEHPLRWGFAFIGWSLLGHLYALLAKK
ncbi:hypothetical protein A3A70_03280 [candidate division WWE3 bacterium RIFCSPLOWO2_01_FULL_42_11]|uniref:2TM domain-containing protein n=1 Tax=candidate division WWE3 bacterium RIFCSPLOWO2_01_FULL_42_11 TaxID=1802627 RepID=A0A1F4VM24_UNCKA|nr:MAG: hypothetical protein A3A70_03280 [candidate division WWE3 bacterium RIFCSPLOWO2_01_FULL_42_11]